MSVYCLYVEKKPPFAVEAGGVLADLRASLGVKGLEGVRILSRYLVEHLSREDFDACRGTVFSAPQVDEIYDDLPDLGEARAFGVEFLPGQFDQRADSCAQCISLITGGERPTVRCARIYILTGKIDDETLAAVKSYLINPIESREASFELPDTLEAVYPAPADVPVVEGFTAMGENALKVLLESMGLAMDLADLTFCRDHFKKAGRNPTVTELRMLDTYWSDHCRHTTFLTRIEGLEIEPDFVNRSYRRYQTMRETLLKDERPITLMDMGTIAAKALKATGYLNRLDESEEINACSVNLRIEVDGKPQDWLLMFKNETHNHPTEIEPFGGAATCLGGAIRDPLSGRSYVYQAMRITGAGNPLADVSETRPGKLPQKKICQTAAAGYSSYGNQIGLATGLVHEIYHPGYEAKRMELGAVIAAAPVSNVMRMRPAPGDKVILLGGRTGRDGCGGATGSSKSHTAQSLESCGSEVQKGNPPEERKIQRLFRKPEAALLIKRCNDFGAGGVSVAIGELADGVAINLDAVPRKYEGLDGTELAISESQERMAVVVAATDVEKFIALADGENLEATVVATVTQEPRLTMEWRGNTIVDLPREFLDSNGAPRSVSVRITAPTPYAPDKGPVTRETLIEKMSSLKYCSQKGLVERFDSSIGSGTVLLPFGGKYQLTPAQTMAAKFPVEKGETKACSLMTWAYDPEMTEWSPYHGGVNAVVESVAKAIAAGGSRSRSWLSFQEYFEKLGKDPVKWGKPAAALLGALEAQMQLQIAAIGGKDSMSGSFEDISVPPTLVSFAISTASADRVVSGEFKEAGSYVYLLAPTRNEEGFADFDDIRFIFDMVEQLILSKRVHAAWAVGSGGTAEAIAKMCFGNHLGFQADKPLSWEAQPGAFVLEAKEPFFELEGFLLGATLPDYKLELPGGQSIDLAEVQAAWEGTLQPVYPYLTKQEGNVEAFSWEKEAVSFPSLRIGARMHGPLVAIPVFPGTNCEYDTAAAFRRAGARTETFILRNLTPQAVSESVEAFAALVARSNVIALPGGFSGGDEPDGSAKFITAFLRNPEIREQIEALLGKRDGLMLGICNGFQALVKLGLVPFGEYRETGPHSPTLAYNAIGRHQSAMVLTRVASNLSPWLSGFGVGEVYYSPVSHGEGRFIADEALIRDMAEKGQIATQYVDLEGKPTMDIRYNPNFSHQAIEGITSPDGRVFGKMAHCERSGEHLYRNLPEHEVFDIFRGAVNYYTL